VLETANDLITNKKIQLGNRYKCWLPCRMYVTPNGVSLRTRIAEIVCRHDRGHPKACKPLLTSRLPVAHGSITTVQGVN